MTTPLEFIPLIETLKDHYGFAVRGTQAPSQGFGSDEAYEQAFRRHFDGDHDADWFTPSLDALGWMLHETHMRIDSGALGSARQQFVTLRERRQEYEVLELIEWLEKLKHTYDRESTRSHIIRKILAGGPNAGRVAADQGFRILGLASANSTKIPKKLRKAAKRSGWSR